MFKNPELNIKLRTAHKHWQPKEKGIKRKIMEDAGSPEKKVKRPISMTCYERFFGWTEEEVYNKLYSRQTSGVLPSVVR